VFCLLAAIFGANEILPIASAGYSSAPWQEIPVKMGLGLSALSITCACIFVLYGLREKAEWQ
jgi:hypothetical protein